MGMSEEMGARLDRAEDEIKAVTQMQGLILESLEGVTIGLQRAATVADMSLGEWIKTGLRRGWILPVPDSHGPVWCYHHDDPPVTHDERTLDAVSQQQDEEHLCLPVLRISREAIDIWEGHEE